MKLNVKRAFLSPFDGEKCLIKLFILGVICSLNTILTGISKTNPKLLGIAVIISIPLNILSSGYYLYFIHNEINDQSSLLPEWKNNIKNFFKKGFDLIIVFLGNFFIFIGFYLVLILPFVLICLMFIKNEIIALTLGIPIMLVFLLMSTLLTQLIICSYADRFIHKDGYLTGIFDKRFFIVKKEIAISLIIFGIIALIESLMVDFLIYTVVGIIFIPWLIAIAFLIPYNLSAQVYKIAKFRVEGITEEEIKPIAEISGQECITSKPKKKKVILSITGIVLVLLIGLIIRGFLYMGSLSFKDQGDYYSTKDNYGKAIENYKNAIDFNDENEGAYVNLADEYLKTKQYKLAVKASTNAVKLDHKDGIAYFNLAQAYQGLKITNKADECFKKARKLKPNIDSFDYMQRVEHKIKLNWNPPINNKKFQTILNFKIDKKGNVSSIVVKKSSKNKSYDNIAISTVKKSSPFDPIPVIYKDKLFNVDFTFDFNKDNN